MIGNAQNFGNHPPKIIQSLIPKSEKSPRVSPNTSRATIERKKKNILNILITYFVTFVFVKC